MICNTIGLTADSFETLYVHGGAEVAEVYGGIGYAQPIFYKTQTLTGATSYSFMAYPEPLTAYEIAGNMVQSGTPTPTNPVYPVECGELVASGEHAGEYVLPLNLSGTTQNLYLSEPIRKMGDYADKAKSDNTTARKIEKYEFTGTEKFNRDGSTGVIYTKDIPTPNYTRNAKTMIMSHYETQVNVATNNGIEEGKACFVNEYLSIRDNNFATTQDFTSFLAYEYAAGHPVTIWYVLAEETTETITSPTLTPTTGNNTLSVGTTLQPSNVSITGHIKPIEYKRLSYIKSTGTQYIQTDIVPSYSDKVEMDVQFGSTAYTSYNSGLTAGYYDNDSGALTVSFGSGASSGITETAIFYDGFRWYSGIGSNHMISNVDVTNRSTVTLQRGTSSWGASTCTVSETITASDPSTGMPIFGCNVANNIRPFDKRDMSLYGFKLYDNNSVLTHDLVPVERFDGTLGLLDTITNKFYSNAGTGTFVKGEYVNV